MKNILIFIFLGIAISAKAQEFIETGINDTPVLTEYHDGRLWAYKQIDDYVVGMTNSYEKSEYGKNYQILIFAKNLSDHSVLFDPSMVMSKLIKKDGVMEEMIVYTHDRYIKKVKNQQAWEMALTGFALGIESGMASTETTYTTMYGVGGVPYTQIKTTHNDGAAAAARIASTTHLMTLERLMSDDKKTISQGYLKKTTLHPDEGIVGYMNIKYKKGERMTVTIPFEGKIFSFEWDVTKKK